MKTQAFHSNATATRYWLFVALLFVLTTSPSVGDDKPKVDDSDTRLKFMKQAVQNFEVIVEDPAGKASAAKSEAPLMRWANPLEGAKDGIIGIFTRTGRPDVSIEFMIFNQLHVAQELTAIAADPIEVSRHGSVIWKPEDRWVTFKKIWAQPAASNPARRLFQMKTLARRFRFVDHFGYDDANIQVNDLRLIPTPIYRYTDKANNVIDGALFLFALGTDPEAFLLVETVTDESGKQHWQYACAESTIYQLEASLDGQVVWKKPRAKVFDQLTTTHFAGNYVPKEGEVSLEYVVP